MPGVFVVIHLRISGRNILPTFASAKFTLAAPRELAVTLYAPRTLFAITFCETVPPAIVNVMGVVAVMLAPEAGAMRTT